MSTTALAPAVDSVKFFAFSEPIGLGQRHSSCEVMASSVKNRSGPWVSLVWEALSLAATYTNIGRKPELGLRPKS